MLPHPGGATPTGPAAASASRSWFDAWEEAAYGPAGFWTRERPADHFRTGAATGPLVAEAVLALARRPPAVTAVVDVGAGDGALLAALAGRTGGGTGSHLVGVDRRPRPAGLPAAVGWVRDHWDVRTGSWRAGGPPAWATATGQPPGPVLLCAHEWLDDLPARVARRDADGWVELGPGEDGAERTCGRLAGADAAWAEQWCPAGGRVEVGRTRDAAWAALVRAAVATGGRALAVDYGHEVADRPTQGTLAAYSRGRQHRPRPDGGLNLTAHVALDALAAAGERAGASTLLRGRQSAVLDALVADAALADPLRDLERRSQRAALTGPGQGGGLWWLLQGAAP